MDYEGIKNAIKDRMNIVDVISHYVRLESSGKNMKAKSPFTNEKTASFFVSPEKNLFYCFSSQKGGDIFSFVQEIEGVDFIGALEILAKRAGIDIDEYKGKGGQSEENKLLQEILSSAEFIYSNIPKNVKEYIEGRGITGESIKKWNIGFVPEGWELVKNKLSKYKEDDLVKAGLLVKGEKGIYDRFRKRVMFSLYSDNNKIIGFSGRIFGEGEPKYINVPDTPLYSKSNYLYGLNFAKQEIRKLDFSILVEGYTDVVMSHQAGFPVAVATSGTSVTKDQLMKLKKLSNKIIFALDGDSAGVRACIRASRIALSIGMEVRVSILEGGKDPADLINEDKEKWREAIKTSKPLITFLIDGIKGKVDKDKWMKKTKEILLPVASDISDRIYRDLAVKEIAEFLDVKRESVESQMSEVKEVVEDVMPKVVYKKDSKEIDLEHVRYFLSYLKKNNEKIGEEQQKIIDELSEFENLVLTEVDQGLGHFILDLSESEEDKVKKANISLEEHSKRLLKELLNQRVLEYSRKLDSGDLGKKDIAKHEEICKNDLARISSL